MAKTVQITGKVGDLVGTMVPFDVTKDEWMIGHHVECRTIIAAQNMPAYIVNGDILIPNLIVVQLLELLAQRRNELAAQGRPATTAWTPTAPMTATHWRKHALMVSMLAVVVLALAALAYLCMYGVN